jgi:tRNA threonylcarbamoyl adenosine modification protein (Sua5/YciO/YrdC/YwlC family)
VKIITLNFQDEAKFDAEIEEAVKFLNEGKVIVYPTDTIYGLGCDATNKEAVEKVCRIKRIIKQKIFSVIVKDIEEIEKYAYLGEKSKNIIKKILPGGFTVVLLKRETVPELFTGKDDTIGIRVPDNIVTQRLSEAFGKPIITTSVDVAGNEFINDPFKMVDYFKELKFGPDLVLDGGKTDSTHPSIIISLIGGKPKILRSGALDVRETLELLTKLQ